MTDPITPLLRRHVETWRRAATELASLHERELRNVDTCAAVRQLFGDNRLVQDAPRLKDSGLVQQQAWFARLRKMRPPG